MPICSGKDKLGESVLNDTLVSIPQGSEHFSFKNKIAYEEELYKIEDQ
jgi:histone deacetylase complex regulatory component SIN3